MVKVHFTRRRSILSYLVRLMTSSKYSHCEIEVDNVCYGAKAFRGVYKQRHINILEQEDTIESWQIHATEAETKKLKAWLEKQVGKKYDYAPALALGFLRQNWLNNQDKWFCSELVDASCKHARIALTNADYKPYKLTPNDLRPSARLRFENKIHVVRSLWKRGVRFFC